MNATPAEAGGAVRAGSPPRVRPAKPRRDFPLFAHGSGQWAKKVRGRHRYFGRWSDPDAALRLWEAQRDDLLAGRPVRPVAADELLVKDLCNEYLGHKKALLDAGEIAPRTFEEYLAACRRLARVVGSTAPVSHLVREDFARLRADMERTWGPARVLNEIRRVRMVFTYGVGQNLIDHLPLYGDAMKRPSAKTLRKARAAKGRRMFEARQLRALIQAAGPTLRTMILLGINCACGNTDVARLERRHLDLRAGWADYPRPKTGVPRRARLWPETIAALRQVLRRQAKGQPARRRRKLVFLTVGGRTWERPTGNPISTAFGRLAVRVGCWRAGLNFYALRHTFETIGGETTDQKAVDYIMGHGPDSRDMSAVYRERIGDDRLAAVAEHVRAWLFGDDKG